MPTPDIDKQFLSSSFFFLLQNTFKVVLQYFFNVFILFNTFSYLRLNFKLKINPKICTFKNLEKICQKHLATLSVLIQSVYIPCVQYISHYSKIPYVKRNTIFSLFKAINLPYGLGSYSPISLTLFLGKLLESTISFQIPFIVRKMDTYKVNS